MDRETGAMRNDSSSAITGLRLLASSKEELSAQVMRSRILCDLSVITQFTLNHACLGVWFVSLGFAAALGNPEERRVRWEPLRHQTSGALSVHSPRVQTYCTESPFLKSG